MTTDLDVVDLSRRRFGITTVFHYIFAPLTIGLAPMVAIMQTIWERTGHERWYRATRFFGNLFLINFAMGVVTGIMQEFQFGMNWPEYASFVGDVFGAPLAFEGLAAFFLRIHLPRGVDLRLGPRARLGPPHLHLDRRGGGQPLRLLHHRGELLVQVRPAVVVEDAHDLVGSAFVDQPGDSRGDCASGCPRHEPGGPC